MAEKLSRYKRISFVGIIVISLGVVFSTTFNESNGSLGIVFIAIGGLLLIAGMSLKSKERNSTKRR